MYDISDLKTAFDSPKAALREANRLYHTRGRRRAYNPNGVAVFDEDWDNLIILDACRYDFFAEQCELPGVLEDRISRGAATFEFIRANFSQRRLHDVIYVTANSWYQRLKDEIDAEVYDFVDLHMGDEDGTYHSEEFKVVLPDVLTERAKAVAREHPNKRIVVHYIQPHHPFIGPTGREHFRHASSSLVEVVEAADGVTPALVREAYRENLDIVLSSVKDLFSELHGKTVITADHGEMLGDRHDIVPIRDFGHPAGIYNRTLTRVPWHIVENGPRKDLVAESPVDGGGEADVQKLERRLEDLGYKM